MPFQCDVFVKIYFKDTQKFVEDIYNLYCILINVSILACSFADLLCIKVRKNLLYNFPLRSQSIPKRLKYFTSKLHCVTRHFRIGYLMESIAAEIIMYFLEKVVSSLPQIL